MKNVNNNFLIIILAFGMILFSCSKDNNDPSTSDPVPELDDTTIAIDDEQAFNMKNFVTSFEQLFVPQDLWMWGFTHEIVNGKAEETYQNLKVFGKFGDKVFTTVHTFNSSGIITSSLRKYAAYFEDDDLVFTYEYNLDGYIVKLYKTEGGDLEDVVEIEYDDQDRILTKKHINFDSKKETTYEDVEEFKYNSEGKYIEWIQTRNGSFNKRCVFTYEGDKVIKRKKYYKDSNYELVFEYNSDNLLISSTEDNGDRETFEYTENIMTESRFEDIYLQSKVEFAPGFIELKYWDYRYGDNDSFEYCTTKENDENGKTSRKEYLEGTVENLILIGYSIIDARDASKSNKKTKESIYDASATRLYYAEFVLTQSHGDYWSISNTNWFKDDATAIVRKDISEDWVFRLVR